jgi:Skp family chaperone for outer membrane proteins
MNRTRIWLIVTTALATVLLLAALQAGGANLAALRPSRAPVVATVDLAALINGMDTMKAKVAEVEAHERQISDMLQSLRSEIEALQSDLDILPPGSDDFVEAQKALDLKQITYQVRRSYESEAAARDRVLVLQDAYRSMVDRIDDFAAEAGIDIIILSSKPGQFPVDSEGRILNFEQTQRAMATWQTLYIGEEFDITDDLLEYLNNN